MTETGKIKTTFMTESRNYYYNIMPFRLRNEGATYQRMMNKVYDKNSVGDILEVYMDDMIIKSKQKVDHTAHLKVRPYTYTQGRQNRDPRQDRGRMTVS